MKEKLTTYEQAAAQVLAHPGTLFSWYYANIK